MSRPDDIVESRWFKLVVVTASGVIVGVSAANIAYFNRIRTGTCSAVSSTEATTMMWFNVGILIASAIIFLWGVYTLLFSKSSREILYNELTSYATSPSQGLLSVNTSSAYQPATAVQQPAMVISNPTLVRSSEGMPSTLSTL